MQNFLLRVPPFLAFGQDVLPRLGAIAREHGKRALIVSEGVLHEGNHVDRVVEILKRAGMETMVYDELMPGSPASTIDELASLARASRSSVVVGLGGMRVLSVARCVSNIAAGSSRIGDLLDGKTPDSSVPYIEVPSSYRNHLMMRDEAIVTDAGRARIVSIAPGTVRAVVLDTGFSQTLSSKYALAAILDTLLAAIEGFFSTDSSLYSDTLLQRAITELHASALMGVRNPTDTRFRYRAAEAGMLTAMGVGVAGQGIGGVLSYVMNARFNLPKSWVSTILLPHVVDLLTPRNAEKAAQVAAALGEPVEGIRAVDDAPRAGRGVRKLLSQLDLPVRLRDLDVAHEDLSAAADDALEYPGLSSVPGGAAPDVLQQLVANAY
ncbi:MAG: iron-containing alcohol dehydrogenase [Spirochaeta sp.]|jgi:alcohol dehydrogenase|nr:iron-containing alcohol dehydrogenase [Spirochaeta sp.]